MKNGEKERETDRERFVQVGDEILHIRHRATSWLKVGNTVNILSWNL